MDRKVVEILYKNRVYSTLFDFKVKLECGHSLWLWNWVSKKSPLGSEQNCDKCDKTPPGLKVFH